MKSLKCTQQRSHEHRFSFSFSFSFHFSFSFSISLSILLFFISQVLVCELQPEVPLLGLTMKVEPIGLGAGKTQVGRGKQLPEDDRLSRNHAEFWVTHEGPTVMVVRNGMNKVQQ